MPRLFVAAPLLLLVVSAGCASSPTATAALTPTTAPTSAAAATAEDVGPEWVETQMSGVTIGMWRPTGWTFDESTGLTLLEHSQSIAEAVSSSDNGVIVNVFAPPLDHYDMPSLPTDVSNPALWVLQHVVSQPGAIGPNSAHSDPQPFNWNGHPAAYYLVSGRDTQRAIVMAIVLENGQMIGVNVSMQADHAAEVRDMLPTLFADFTLSGLSLGGDALDSLPDPLSFPLAGSRETAALSGG